MAFFLLFAIASSLAASAQPAAPVSERQVKAAFVYKFAAYVEWPPGALPDAGAPLTIGVIGADAIADELARIAVGRTIAERKVTIRRLKPGDDLAGLQVIFIGRSGREQLSATLRAARGRGILMVTESEEGLRLGSTINLVVVADKVRFDVALPAAEASRLKISSRLLAVAREVVTATP